MWKLTHVGFDRDWRAFWCCFPPLRQLYLYLFRMNRKFQSSLQMRDKPNIPDWLADDIIFSHGEEDKACFQTIELANHWISFAPILIRKIFLAGVWLSNKDLSGHSCEDWNINLSHGAILLVCPTLKQPIIFKPTSSFIILDRKRLKTRSYLFFSFSIGD